MRLILAGTPAFAWEIFAPLLDDDFLKLLRLFVSLINPLGEKPS